MGGLADVGVARVNLERAPRGRAHEEDGDGEGEAADDGDRLERSETAVGGASDVASLEERDGDGALSPAPEDLLDDGGVEHATGGDDVVDVGTGVGGGDEVEHETDEEDDVDELLHFVVGLENVEELHAAGAAREKVVALVGERDGGGGDGITRLTAVAHRLAQRVARDVSGIVEHRGDVADAGTEGELGDALHLDGEGAPGAEPEEAEEGRGDESTDDHLAQGAALGDAGDEHADEGAQETHQPQ